MIDPPTLPLKIIPEIAKLSRLFKIGGQVTIQPKMMRNRRKTRQKQLIKRPQKHQQQLKDQEQPKIPVLQQKQHRRLDPKLETHPPKTPLTTTSSTCPKTTTTPSTTSQSKDCPLEPTS